MQTATVRRRLVGVVAAGLVLAGCGAASDTADTSAEQDMADDGMDDVADPMDGMPADTDEMSDDMDDMEDGEHDDMGDDVGAVAADDFQTAIVGTTPEGGTLTLADFAGQQVFVETFATWCSNCRRQLEQTQQAAVAAGGDAVFLVLSVETDLDPARLADYAADNGFDDLTFAVLDAEALPALVGEFGNSVLNPPATPKFTVAADGARSGLTTGAESVDEILSQLDA